MGGERDCLRRGSGPLVLATVVTLTVLASSPCLANLAFALEDPTMNMESGWPQTVSHLPVAGPMAETRDGHIFVVRRRTVDGSSTDQQRSAACVLWRLRVSQTSIHDLSAEAGAVVVQGGVAFNDVVSLVSTKDAVWVGTDKGILKARGATVEQVRPRALKLAITTPVYSDFTQDGVKGSCVDTNQAVWVIPNWIWPAICVFDSDPPYESQQVFHLTGIWAHALCAATSGRGVWVVASQGKRNAIVHLTDDLLPTSVQRRQSPWPHSIAIRSLLDQAPTLDLSGIRVGAWGNALWIAGESENAVHILVCENNALKEQRGFEQLLGNSRVTDIAFDKVGTVYFATDGAGVIVFDGQQWQPHPMNNDLPVVAGTNRKPVNYVLPLSDGRVAVCTGEYLLIWSGEERKEHR